MGASNGQPLWLLDQTDTWDWMINMDIDTRLEPMQEPSTHDQDRPQRPYLVSGRVTITQYMCDTGKPVEHQRIVMATDPYQAAKKFERYWESRTDEYSIYYSVGGVQVFDTIE